MTLKKDLLQILLSLPNTQEVRVRKALISYWGLDRLSTRITFEGENRVFFNELIEFLLPEGIDFILKFLEKLSQDEGTGLDLREQLQNLKDKIAKLDRENWRREFIGDFTHNDSSNAGSTLDSYLIRQDIQLRQDIQSQCCQEILKPGAFLRIKAPRYMGKTFLMRGIIQQVKQNNYYGVRLPFAYVEPDKLRSLELFLKWFCQSIIIQFNQELDEAGIQLQLSSNLEEHWTNNIGIGQKFTCKLFFQRNILSQINKPLVLGLDDIDKIYEYPQIIHDFLGLLREWHEETKDKEIWKNLRLIVTYSKQVPVQPNIFESPINVGNQIILKDLTKTEIHNLTRKYTLNWNIDQVEKLMNMIGGYPFLVVNALKNISSQRINLDQFLETASTNNSIYGEHLQAILTYLQEHLNLSQIMKKILEKPVLISDYSEEIRELENMGLIEVQDRKSTIRCRLYQIYLQNNL